MGTAENKTAKKQNGIKKMEIRGLRINEGKPFDWGRTSADYAIYRDIYPDIFYRKIAGRGLCINQQRVLDLGTGTGTLPRNMYRFGARWTGVDSSSEQIEQARRLSAKAGMDIEYMNVPAEEVPVPEEPYDIITACQCFWYFDLKKLLPGTRKLLKEDGKLVILQMPYLADEDEIAAMSEATVQKYNPCSEKDDRWKKEAVRIPGEVTEYFIPEDHEEYRVNIPFTRETWHGRVRACRRIGASLSAEETAMWEKEHLALLEKFPEQFEIVHHVAMAVLKRK